MASARRNEDNEIRPQECPFIETRYWTGDQPDNLASRLTPQLARGGSRLLWLLKQQGKRAIDG